MYPQSSRAELKLMVPGNVRRRSSASTQATPRGASLFAAPGLPTSMSSAAAQYKKKDGTLSISRDGKTVSWEAVGGVLPPLAIAIADIQSKSAASYKESGC